jgi:hypothetical protein
MQQKSALIDELNKASFDPLPSKLTTFLCVKEKLSVRKQREF